MTLEVTLAGRVSDLEVALRTRARAGAPPPAIRPESGVAWVQKAEGGEAPSDALCDSIGFALGVRAGLVRDYLTGVVNARTVADEHADAAALLAQGGFLGDAAILRAVRRREIVVEPFSLADLQANSYDVHLGPVLRVYRRGKQPLDARKPCEMADVEIGPHGLTLQPGRLYLGSTVERTESPRHLPFLNGKCFAKGTRVWMHDGRLVPIEEVAAGDVVLGMQGSPRRVVETHRGVGALFRVRQSNGMEYVTNDAHELVLRCGRGTANKRFPEGAVVEVSVRDFVGLPSSLQKKLYGFRGVAEFGPGPGLPIDPYLLGVWLGDGTSSEARLTINNEDSELLEHLRTSFPLAVFHQYKPGAQTIVLSTHARDAFKRPNDFLAGLRILGVLDNKHIPDAYRTASLCDRLALLAGLLDTDGHASECSWEITTKYPALRDGIIHLAHSVGLATSVVLKRAMGLDYHRICIWGDVLKVPVKLSRKRNILRPSRLPSRSDSRLSVEPIGDGEYFGFSLEGDEPEDRRFFLEDFTVVHNSSVGRLGIRVHATAGNGDVGFRGHFTLEIDVIEPVRVYAGMAIGQLVWSSVQGPVVRPYGSRKSSKYQNQGAAPVASRMHMNFPKVPRG